MEKEVAKLKVEASKPIERSNSTGGSSVNMSIVLKDLEDSKNLLERKNNEIIQLKKHTKELDDEVESLKSQLAQLRNEMQKYE